MLMKGRTVHPEMSVQSTKALNILWRLFACAHVFFGTSDFAPSTIFASLETYEQYVAFRKLATREKITLPRDIPQMIAILVQQYLSTLAGVTSVRILLIIILHGCLSHVDISKCSELPEASDKQLEILTASSDVPHQHSWSVKSF